MRKRFAPQCDGLESRLALSTVVAAVADTSTGIIWPTSGSGGGTTGQAATSDAPVSIIWPTSGSGGGTTGQ